MTLFGQYNHHGVLPFFAIGSIVMIDLPIAALTTVSAVTVTPDVGYDSNIAVCVASTRLRPILTACRLLQLERAVGAASCHRRDGDRRRILPPQVCVR